MALFLFVFKPEPDCVERAVVSSPLSEGDTSKWLRCQPVRLLWNQQPQAFLLNEKSGSGEKFPNLLCYQSAT